MVNKEFTVRPQSGINLSVSQKIVCFSSIAIIAALIIVGCTSLYLSKQQLTLLQVSNSINAAHIIGDDIKDYMLANDMKKIDAKIHDVIERKQLLSLSVFNNKGIERGSGLKDNPLVAKALQTGQTVNQEAIANGIHTLETFLPMANEERCKQCHMNDGAFLGVIKLSSSVEQAYDATKHSGIVMALCAFAALVVSIIFLFVMLKLTIMRKINEFVSNVFALAEGDGDLTKRLDTSGSDELSKVSRYFNGFLDSLERLIASTALSAVNVTATAGSIQTSSQNMSKGIEVAAFQATSVATASEEMSATSGSIAQNCSMASDSSQHSNALASEGMAVIQTTISGMNRISERVQSASTVIDSLGARSDQIGAIVGTIEDIADQTNLLALNAAIEAARAGEQGRGFAVVADEVRALAERTTRATREISEMIKAIQKETKIAVDAMEAGVSEVNKGMEEAARSGEALQQMLHQISEVASQIQQIATAAEEQTATTSEISTNIHQITGAFNKAATTAHQTSTEAENLNKLSEELQNTVRKFKTRESDVLMLAVAANDHRLFVNKIRSAVIGDTQLEASGLPDHHTCRFGKWYDSDGQSICGHLSKYKAINGPHERIHSLSKEAVAAVSNGNQSRADSLMQEIEHVSQSIMVVLDETRRDYISGKQ